MNDTRQSFKPPVFLPTNFMSYFNLSSLSIPDWTFHLLSISGEFWKEVVEWFMTLGWGLSGFAAFYLIVGFASYLIQSYYCQPKSRKRVMIVTAHPDDEVMFFGPTIMQLRETCDIYLLCLSTGDMYGKKNERKKELWASCKVLGIPASNITLLSYDEFPDDPQVMWSAKEVYGCLYALIDTLEIQEVYTFDNEGVSGHLNHISIFYGFARMSMKKKVPPYCKIYLLESVNKIRKYSAYFDATTCFFPMHHKVYVASFNATRILRKAMRAHESQMVWFRTLYIYFSRYMYINTYRELNQDDVQLVLQMTEYNYQ